MPDTFTERTRAQREPVRAKQRLEECLTERARGTAIAGHGNSAAELVDGAGQVSGRYQSAKSGVRNACALEVLTFPCRGAGVSDRLRTRIRGAEELFHAIVEELCGDGV